MDADCRKYMFLCSMGTASDLRKYSGLTVNNMELKLSPVFLYALAYSLPMLAIVIYFAISVFLYSSI